jgi:hypothetical protein
MEDIIANGIAGFVPLNAWAEPFLDVIGERVDYEKPERLVLVAEGCESVFTARYVQCIRRVFPTAKMCLTQVSPKTGGRLLIVVFACKVGQSYLVLAPIISDGQSKEGAET